MDTERGWVACHLSRTVHEMPGRSLILRPRPDIIANQVFPANAFPSSNAFAVVRPYSIRWPGLCRPYLRQAHQPHDEDQYDEQSEFDVPEREFFMTHMASRVIGPAWPAAVTTVHP